MSKLTDIAIKKLGPREKQFTVADGGGLSLLIKPNGTKAWRYNYRYGGKQKTLALGVYPEITLKAARDSLLEAKSLLRQEIDPAQAKQERKRQQKLNNTNTFETICHEWWLHQCGTWTPTHSLRVQKRLEHDVYPYLGHMAITDITPQDVIEVIRRVEQRNALDVAKRELQDINRVCRYAVQTGRLKHNPATDLVGILKNRKTYHRDSLPREELPAFLKSLEGYESHGRLLTKYAIQLLTLTFVRPGELRGARWEEFDLDEKLWRIPAARMKMRTDHIVPLSKQALAVIEKIKPISQQYPLLFPSERNRNDFMSDNTMRKAIFRLGYDGNTSGKSKVTPHGFRATASSILNEEGFNPDAIERQLSHMERNGVRAAYIHHARFLDERREMMQWWGDYIERLAID